MFSENVTYFTTLFFLFDERKISVSKKMLLAPLITLQLRKNSLLISAVNNGC